MTHEENHKFFDRLRHERLRLSADESKAPSASCESGVFASGLLQTSRN